MPKNTIFDMALAYAEAGFPIVPCSGKIALLSDVAAEASSDQHTGHEYTWEKPLIELHNGVWRPLPLPILPNTWVEQIIEAALNPAEETQDEDLGKCKAFASYKDYFQWLITRIDKLLPPGEGVDLESRECSFDDLKEAAEGCWEDIVQALCPDPEGVLDESPYTTYQRCPVCGEDHKFKRFSEFDETGSCRCFHCHRDFAVDGIGLIAWTLQIASFSNTPNLYAKNLIWYALESGFVK